MELLKNINFKTPKNSKQLEEYIEALPPKMRSVALSVAGQTWNLACRTVETANKLETLKRSRERVQ